VRKIYGVALLILGCMFAAACGSSSSSSSGGASPSSGSAVASSTSSTSSASSGPAASDATTSSASTAGATATEVTTKHSKFGTILAAGPKQLTVYMFEADMGPAPHCSGACAAAWPPVIAKGTPAASGTATSADLGTTTRSGGVKQVTYKGHPLYYFIKDKDDGDAYGQGSHAFGADWYVLAPNGDKVDNS
jgi:predicted lipoprotein with Yx(FWY)xxD motif